MDEKLKMLAAQIKAVCRHLGPSDHCIWEGHRFCEVTETGVCWYERDMMRRRLADEEASS